MDLNYAEENSKVQRVYFYFVLVPGNFKIRITAILVPKGAEVTR